MPKDLSTAVQVPDHILDMVAVEANDYVQNRTDRLLGAYTDEGKRVVNRLSTHIKMSNPERRELHRKIISESIGQALKSQQEKQDRPTMIMFVGPPGAGKTTLKEKFDKGDISPTDNPHLYKAYCAYKNAYLSNVSVDFEYLKSQLPEYRAANIAYKDKFGDMYAVIRPEASGLNVAILQFAKELGLTTISEQLMDSNQSENPKIQQMAKDYNLVLIGVTCNPETSRNRVKERENPMHDTEVTRAIQGFSDDNAFQYISKLASSSYLFNTDNQKYETVQTTENGEKVYSNPKLLEKFNALKDFQPELIDIKTQRAR